MSGFQQHAGGMERQASHRSWKVTQRSPGTELGERRPDWYAGAGVQAGLWGP